MDRKHSHVVLVSLFVILSVLVGGTTAGHPQNRRKHVQSAEALMAEMRSAVKQYDPVRRQKAQAAAVELQLPAIQPITTAESHPDHTQMLQGVVGELTRAAGANRQKASLMGVQAAPEQQAREDNPAYQPEKPVQYGQGTEYDQKGDAYAKKKRAAAAKSFKQIIRAFARAQTEEDKRSKTKSPSYKQEHQGGDGSSRYKPKHKQHEQKEYTGSYDSAPTKSDSSKKKEQNEGVTSYKKQERKGTSSYKQKESKYVPAHKHLQQLLKAGIKRAEQQIKQTAAPLTAPATLLVDQPKGMPVTAEVPPQQTQQQLHDAVDAGNEVMQEIAHLGEQAPADQHLAPDGVVGVVPRPSACSQKQISHIKCWLDSDGFVTGLAFESEAGVTSPAMCSAEKGQLVDGGALSEGESILDVVACRPKGASAGGVSWLEFHTTSTKGFPVTCGQGAKSADNKPLFSAGRAATLGEQCDSLTGSQLFDASRASTQEANSTAPGVFYPMGGLRASCNAVKQLSAFTNKCLDSRSITPGKVVDPIKLEVKLTFNDGPSEANAAADSVSCDASMCQSDTASKQVVMGLDTVINSLVHEWNIQPDLTTQHAVAICKTSSAADRQDALNRIQQSLGTNLCSAGYERSCKDMRLVAMILTAA